MESVEKRVLVVDDNAAICRLLRRILSAAGWHVQVAGTCKEARDAFTAGGFAAAFVDVDLGGADGIALARGFLEQEPHLRLRMMSGASESAERVKDAGLGPLLAKPFSVDEVASSLSGGRG